ncbi:hypothetical protein [Mumia sp. DW29H23]|uniref:hypothetical protein n=1 Tax=Mumia sp. DW29H23 TaxID=3421241 RepID=UPI003D693676
MPSPDIEEMEKQMKKYVRIGAMGVGLAGLVVTSAGAAYANHTAVSIGGNTSVASVAYTAANDTAEISFMTNYGVQMRCSIATINGSINRGTVVNPGNTVASIGNLFFDDCWMGAFPLSVTMTGATIDVRTHPTNAGDPVAVVITDIDAHIETTDPNVPCAFDAAGTLDAVITPGSGAKDAVLTLAPAVFSGPNPVSGFDLEISGVFGCGGEVQNGDLAGGFYYDEPNAIPSAFAVDTAGLVTHS